MSSLIPIESLKFTEARSQLSSIVDRVFQHKMRVRLYKGNIPGGDAGIVGWTTTTGAPDDQLHSTFVFEKALGAGSSQTPVVSSYDGSTANGFMYGAETPHGGSAYWDGVITIRFSAPGYADAVLTAAYVQ